MRLGKHDFHLMLFREARAARQLFEWELYHGSQPSRATLRRLLQAFDLPATEGTAEYLEYHMDPEGFRRAYPKRDPCPTRGIVVTSFVLAPRRSAPVDHWGLLVIPPAANLWISARLVQAARQAGEQHERFIKRAFPKARWPDEALQATREAKGFLAPLTALYREGGLTAAELLPEARQRCKEHAEKANLLWYDRIDNPRCSDLLKKQLKRDGLWDRYQKERKDGGEQNGKISVHSRRRFPVRKLRSITLLG